ncbi:MAG: iron ABC transporter permease [bacterium]
MERTFGSRINIFFLKIFLLFLFTTLTAFVCLLIGTIDISISELFKILFGKESASGLSQIILEIRLPRILLAIAVGGGLSVAGAVFQSILLNPLAEPYILGISSGGTFGAVLAMLLGLSFWIVQISAFSGAIIVVFLVFVLGRRFGEIEPNVLLLSGVMVGAFFAAVILLMVTMLGESLRTAVLWLIGNLSTAKKDSVYIVLPLSIIFSFILSINGQKFNVLSLGTETAQHLGIDTKFVKNFAYIISSLLIGSIVSVSGIIGFVGLIVPHSCRMIFGSDNKIVIPASFFIGASYLVIADTIARTIISPSEIPVGAVTAIIGAPVFVYLLRKRWS